ncbi:hypothetical protein GCN74_17630 [Janthinobacterium sp. FT14W]|uniref:hypothetical protein n=1 Tax=Janthinobacterium sp. FT14W TaxID=2654253 RepID=UPI0012648F76|nr:hypothetical protein [Janthinobacterium sp. FT14W]KAB8058043.1 hypothetical protein GCN74_17630 [Janthinobacterium sp. FT14W]
MNAAMTSAAPLLRATLWAWNYWRACSPACLWVCLLVCLLGGCAAGRPAQDAAAETLPIAVPCKVARPSAPVLPAVPQHGIFAQAQALLAREQLRAAYVRQLEALVDGCAGS